MSEKSCSSVTHSKEIRQDFALWLENIFLDYLSHDYAGDAEYVYAAQQSIPFTGNATVGAGGRFISRHADPAPAVSLQDYLLLGESGRVQNELPCMATAQTFHQGCGQRVDMMRVEAQQNRVVSLKYLTPDAVDAYLAQCGDRVACV